MKDLSIYYKISILEINDFLTVLDNLYLNYEVENKTDFYYVKVDFENVVDVKTDFDVLNVEKECKIDNVSFEIVTK